MTIDVVFVMVGTTHTGNLGASARAMKTMGFHNLRLVQTCPHLTAEALARSSGANDVLHNAECFESLADAISDCRVVIGTSARARQLAVPMLSCRQLAEELGQLSESVSEQFRVAVVFGHERSGLSNESLDLCTRLLRIPCNPDFSSLNLGSAVQVVAYEFSQSLETVPQGALKAMPGKWQGTSSSVDSETEVKEPGELPATSDDMGHFFEHLDRIMINTGFMDPENPRLVRRKVRRYFESNRPSSNELALFRGLLSATENPKKNRAGERLKKE